MLREDEREEQRGTACEHADDQDARPALLVPAQQREHDHEERRAERDEPDPVDPAVLLVERLTQLGDGQDGRDDADRDVDEEDPAPREVGRQRTADQRADRDRCAGRRAPDAERGSALAPLELLRQERQRGGEHDRAADPLARAREDQEERRGGRAAEHGGRGEEHDPADEDALAPEQVGERPRVEDEGRERQRVGVDHPLEVGEGRAEVAGDRRQRYVHDRDVEQEHEDRQADDDERPPLPLEHPPRVPRCPGANRPAREADQWRGTGGTGRVPQRRPMRSPSSQSLEETAILARKTARWGCRAYFRVRTHADLLRPLRGTT